MPNIDEAIEALLAYQQADMEGVMVLTSRQAIHEVADEIERLRDEIERQKDRVAAHKETAIGLNQELLQARHLITAPAQSSQVRAETIEECAKAAEDQALAWLNGEAGTIYGQGYQAACRVVARALRALPAAQTPAAPVETERADAMGMGLNQDAFRRAWTAFQNTPIDLLDDSDDQTCKCVANAIKAFLAAERRYTEREVAETVEKVISEMMERGEIADTRNSVSRSSAGTGDLDELQSELTDSLKPQGELRPLCLKAAEAIADLRHDIERHIQIAADLASAQPQGVPDVRKISDEDMRELLSAKDVGTGRARLKRFLSALSRPHGGGE